MPQDRRTVSSALGDFCLLPTAPEQAPEADRPVQQGDAQDGQHQGPHAVLHNDLAGQQGLRVREYEIEGVFSVTATEQDLANFHVGVLRAFGIGQDLPERKFPGLLDEEGDEAEYRWAVKGETTQSITIRLGIQYVQTYN